MLAVTTTIASHFHSKGVSHVDFTTIIADVVGPGGGSPESGTG